MPRLTLFINIPTNALISSIKLILKTAALHHQKGAPWGWCKNIETCRSSFNINFILLISAFAGILINIFNQNSRYEQKNY